ncbi:MAG: hypothetical protein P8016_01285 [Sedimentisphaerales bacterium]
MPLSVVESFSLMTILLDDLAPFLAEMPNRIVISEKDSTTDNGNESLGLQRAWAVVYYLTSRHNIDKDRFSISIDGTLAADTSSNDQESSERELEISLLQRSVYN